MKLNRTWAMVVAIVMALTLSLGGTMAYLQDSDSDVNVMTLGNVDILQNEQQLAEDGVTLEEFKQNKDLYPGTEISKIVTVTNKGRSDAYFRTLIAFEDIESETFGINFPIAEFSGYTWSWAAPEATIVVDGVTYQVYEALYTAVLKPGETSPASLTKVELAASATNEDMEALGYDYEILVLTQAVQTAGFDSAQAALDEAFGDVNATNAALWFGADFPESESPSDNYPSNNPPTLVASFDDIKDALANGDNAVALNGDITVTENMDVDVLNLSGEGSFDLNDKTFTGVQNISGNVTVSNGTVENDNVGIEVTGGDVAVSDVVLNAGTPGTNYAYGYAAIANNGSNMVLDNVNINAKNGAVAVSGGAKAIFNSGVVAVNSQNTSGRYNFYVVDQGSELTINDGTFSFSSQYNQKRAYIYAGAGTTVEINGGTFGKASTKSGYTDGIMGEGTVIIKGGTFGFNPTKWVAEGYVANYDETAKTWTVVAE